METVPTRVGGSGPEHYGSSRTRGKHGGKEFFTYGHTTQHGHMLAGEEKFLLEWDVKRGDVTYEILSYSKPDNWLSTITYPAVQYFQGKFAKESIAQMQRTTKM
eukprot:scaffold905_cov363-Pavlova_lutheri.AAC.20